MVLPALRTPRSSKLPNVGEASDRWGGDGDEETHSSNAPRSFRLEPKEDQDSLGRVTMSSKVRSRENFGTLKLRIMIDKFHDINIFPTQEGFFLCHIHRVFFVGATTDFPPLRPPGLAGIGGPWGG